MRDAPLVGMATYKRFDSYSIFIPTLMVLECTTIVVGFIMMMVVFMLH